MLLSKQNTELQKITVSQAEQIRIILAQMDDLREIN